MERVLLSSHVQLTFGAESLEPSCKIVVTSSAPDGSDSLLQKSEAAKNYTEHHKLISTWDIIPP